MAFVVLEDCIQCKAHRLRRGLPGRLFLRGPNFLVIDPDECIDCMLCEPECPIDAIAAEDDVPDDQ